MPSLDDLQSAVFVWFKQYIGQDFDSTDVYCKWANDEEINTAQTYGVLDILHDFPIGSPRKIPVTDDNDVIIPGLYTIYQDRRIVLTLSAYGDHYVARLVNAQLSLEDEMILSYFEGKGLAFVSMGSVDDTTFADPTQYIPHSTFDVEFYYEFTRQSNQSWIDEVIGNGDFVDEVDLIGTLEDIELDIDVKADDGTDDGANSQ